MTVVHPTGIEPASPLLTAAERIQHLPMLPSVALEVLQMVDDPTVSVLDVKAAISRDAGLCARILKVANSSLFGQSRQIKQIDRAVMLLGLKIIRNLIIIASMDRFFHIECDRGTFRSVSGDLWRHSTQTATAARMLAQAMPTAHADITADEFFVAGLIHDIGIMAELHLDRTQFLPALMAAFPGTAVPPAARPSIRSQRPASQPDLRAIETDLFGMDHALLGSEICDRWQFPLFLVDCVAWHHEPRQAPPGTRSAAALICIADRLAASLPGGFDLDLPDFEVDRELASWTGLDLRTCVRVRDRLWTEARAVASQFA